MTGLVPGGGLPVELASTLATLVVAAFTLLPALGLAWWLGRRAGWDWPTTVAASFAFEMAIVGSVALAAHYAGGSLGTVLGVGALLLLALSLAGIVLGLRGGRGVPDDDSSDGRDARTGRWVGRSWEGFVLAAGGGILAVAERPWFGQTSDTFYHLAAIRSLLVTSRPMVTDPFYGLPLRTLDPTSGVWQTQLALISKVTTLDPSWLWPGVTAVGAALTLLSFWVLARTVSGSARAATVSGVAFLVTVVYLDVRWFAYPNQMSLALVLAALAGVVALMRRPHLADAALVVAAGFSAISLHLAAAAVIVLVAAFLGLLLVAAVVVRGVRERAWEWRSVGVLAATGAVLAVAATAVVLPKAAIVAHSPLVGYRASDVLANTIALGPWRIAGPGITENVPQGWLFYAGLLLAVLAAAPAFRDGDRRALAAFGIAAFPAALLMDPPLSSWLLKASPYMTARIAILLPFTVLTGLAWVLPRTSERTRAGRMNSAGAALTLLLAVGLAVWPVYRDFALPVERYPLAVSYSRVNDMRAVWGEGTMKALAATLDSGYPRVGGDTVSTFYVTGLLPVAVSAVPTQHAPFAVEAVDGAQRRAEMDRLMDPSTPQPEKRRILARRGIDYVIVPTRLHGTRAALDSMRSQSDLFVPVVRSSTVWLFAARPFAE